MNIGRKYFRNLNIRRNWRSCGHVVGASKTKGDAVLPFEHIPSAKGLPVVGTVLDLIAAGSAPQLHKYIDNRHHELGPIFREKLGPQTTIFLSSASLMRSVFLYEGQYPKHPLPDAWTLYNQKHKCQRGLFFMNGPEWLENRRIMNPLLLNDIDWMNSHINRCTRKLIETWRIGSYGEEFVEIQELEKQLYRWSIDVICSITFGQGYSKMTTALKDKITIFANEVQKIFETSSVLMNFPAKLAERLNLKMWSEFDRSLSDVLSIGNQIIDMFLRENKCEDGLLYQMRESGMSDDVIKRIFVDLITAAGDTTAFSTQWVLYILSKSTEIQKTIRDETDPEKKDNYIKGLLRETLRLYPVAPFIGRFLDTDGVIGGYSIAENTLVILSLYTSGRDSNHFPDPLSVKPERWLRDSTSGGLNEVLMAHGTMPFAIGRRSCIGRKIALNQMSSLVEMVSKNFDLKCLNPTPLDVTLRLVAIPNMPLQVGLKNR